MKKTGIIKALLLAVTGLCSLATATATISWFLPKAHVQVEKDPLQGSTMGAYFAYGNGIPTGAGNRAYGITKPRHLYNLAWLQYLGYFDDVDSGPMNQYYFEIGEMVDENGDPTDVLDMTGWVLPPIGTAEHPFVGNFDGKGKQIVNLTVSNDFGEYNTHPAAISGWSDDYKQPEIVGLFGVVGQLKTTLNYTTATNEVKNLSIDNLTIQVNSTSKKALIGFAAGYVNGNVSNVAVGGGKFDIAANSTSVRYSDISSSGADSFMPNISNYSTVGYCTDTYLKNSEITTKDVKTPEVVNGAGAGLGNQYGASIPMKDFYDHLLTVKGPYTSASSNVYTYNTRENAYYNNNMLVTTEAASGSSQSSNGMSYTVSFSSGTVTCYYTGTPETDEQGNIIASYTFTNRNDTDSYMYLDGQRSASTNTTTYRFDKADAYTISVGGHYLTYGSTTSVTDGNGSSDLSKWIYEDNKLFCGHTENHANYYLRSTGAGNLTLTTSADANCNWTRQQNGTFKNNSNNVYIVYNNGWTTSTSANSITMRTIYTTVNSTKHYLTRNNTSFADTATESSGAIWYADGNYFYTLINGEKYYIVGSTTLSNSSGTKMYIVNNSYLGTGTSNNSTYLRYNNGWTTSNRSNRTSLTFGSYDFSLTQATSSSTTGYKYTSSSSTTFKTDPTYFPLKYNYNYTDVSSINTGYVVSGANSSANPKGDIRISEYELTDLSKSFNGIYGDNNYIGYIGNDGYYIGINNGTLTTVNSISDAVAWDTSTVPISTSINNVTYYLLLSNSPYTPIVGTRTSDGSYAFGLYNNKIHVYSTNGQTRYSNYLYYNTSSSAWTIPTSGNGSKFSVDFSSATMEIITRVPQKTDGTTLSGYVRVSDNYNANNTSVNSDISGLSKINYKDLGLKKYSTARGYLENTLSEGNGNIYGLHFMDASISTSKLVEVGKAMVSGTEYLYNPNATSASESLEIWEHTPILDAKGKIQKDEHGEIIANRHKVGATSGKYTLPQDCIDFTLAETGRINFFAGSYFSGNNAFFSLHQIFRDDTTKAITGIKQISQVYENIKYDSMTNNEVPKYIYKYSDNSYSATDNQITGAGAIKRGSTAVFDLSWITNPGGNSMDLTSTYFNCAFYFEIPANDGEYALGSVSGKNGAYLMYLDIGASDESKEITIIRHVINTTTEEYSLPKGVDFVIVTVTDSIVSSFSVTGGEAGTVVVPKTVSGNNISFTMANKILTCGPPSTGEIRKATYIADGYTFKYGNGDNDKITLVNPDHTTEIEQTIETKYTYDIEGSRFFTDITESISKTYDGQSVPVNNPDTIHIEETGVSEETYYSTYLIAVNDEFGDTFVKFHYHSSKDAVVNITYKLKYTMTGGDIDEPVGYYTYILYFDTSEDIEVFVDEIAEGCHVDFMKANQASPTLPSHYVSAFSDVTVSTTTSYTIPKYVTP